jgi:RNA polymerase sigma-70 factor (ECF subfamily)
VEAAAPANPTPAEAISNAPASKLSPAPAATAPVVSDDAGEVDAMDEASRDWLRRLLAATTRDDAVARLEALLLQASRFEVARRRSTLPHSATELDRVARAATGHSLAQVLARLDDYDGASRFSTWAAKFVLQETAIRLRELGWQERQTAEVTRARHDLPRAIGQVLDAALSAEQCEVFTSLSFSRMPIDVLADRLGSTRAAVYETLRDARRRVREHLG